MAKTESSLFRRLRDSSEISAATSRSMSGNRAKDTKPEVLLRKALWAAGARGYRKHLKLPGRPDIVFIGQRLAIFVHGCYWHRCPTCMSGRFPKSNENYWREKFAQNLERDKKNKTELEALGYHVEVVWECEIKADVWIVAARLFRSTNKLIGM